MAKDPSGLELQPLLLVLKVVGVGPAKPLEPPPRPFLRRLRPSSTRRTSTSSRHRRSAMDGRPRMPPPAVSLRCRSSRKPTALAKSSSVRVKEVRIISVRNRFRIRFYRIR